MNRFYTNSGKCALWVFLFFSALYIFSMGGHGYGGVGTTTYDVTRSIVLEHSVAIQPVPWGKVGYDGRFYAQYGIGHSVYNIPFYLLGHALTLLSPALAAQYARLTMFTTLLGQPVISALTCALLLLFCRKAGYALNTSCTCALLYGLGTQAWMYAQLDFSEPILTFFLLSAAYLAHRPGGRPAHSAANLVLSGLCLGIAMTVKIVAVIVLPVFFVYIMSGSDSAGIRSSLKKAVLFGFPVLLAGFGIVGAYNMLRFANPFETGYGSEFTFCYTDVLRHIGENLWGLEGSIFFYSPVILLALCGARRFFLRFGEFALLTWGVVATFFLFYPFTTNELYYGPRYLTPTLPFFLVVTGAYLENSSIGSVAQTLRKYLIAGLLVLGIGQQLLGVVVNYHTFYWRIQYTLPLADETVRLSDYGQLLRATPELPHIQGHLWLVKHAVSDLFHRNGFPLQGIELLSNVQDRNAFIPYYGLDLWWAHAKFVAASGGVMPVAIVLFLISVMGAALFRLRDISCQSGNVWWGSL